MNSKSDNLDIEKVTLTSIVVTNAAINNESQISRLEDGKHEFDLTYLHTAFRLDIIDLTKSLDIYFHVK